MDATVDVVDLTAAIPGSRPIAQFYIDDRSAVGPCAIEREQPARSKLLEFRNRLATVKNLDIPSTIPARSLKPYAPSYVLVEDFRDPVVPECDRVASPAVNCIALS